MVYYYVLLIQDTLLFMSYYLNQGAALHWMVSYM